jgi:hypothetical protein
VSRILEQGEIFFFYQPRVGVEEVRGLGDVARFSFILKPDRRRRYRRVIVGRKRLPEPDHHEREWAFVYEVVDDPEKLEEELEQREYETNTRGIRVEPEARPVGEGRYAIVDHDGHTHLAYVLELPREPGAAQATFGLRAEASFVMAIRNPEAGRPPGTGLPPHARAQYPPELMERFRGRRFAPVDDPRFLDHPGAEVLLIGAAEDVEGELGIELDPKHLELDTAAVFRTLRLRPDKLPVDPLERGELR